VLAEAGRLESTFDAAEEKEYARPESASFLPCPQIAAVAPEGFRQLIRSVSTTQRGVHLATSETVSASANSPPRRERAPDRTQSLSRLRLGLWVFAVAAGAGAAAMTLANEGSDGLGTPNGLKFLIGLAFAGSGLYAWGRRPENRLGPLMTVVGCTYLAAQILSQAHASHLFTAGIWLSDAWVVLFVLFLLAFPDGQIGGRFDLFVIGMFALMAFPLELLWLLFFQTGSSPENALVVWPNDGLAGNVDSAQRALVVLASVVLAVTLTRRWIVASPPLRRALVPILVGSVGILLGSVLVALDKFRIEFPTARWAVVVAYIAVPLVVLGGILRSRLARSTVGDLFVELRADPTPGELRDALARTLRDPSLTLAYWLPQFRSWSDLDGRPVQLPAEGDDSAATMIDRNGEHMAALVHDPALVDEPELLEAVSAAAGIAIENGRLHVELRARLEELRGSRSRIVEASQKERQRLERNLHDGAQQRLIALLLDLSLLEQELAADGGAAIRLAQARREIATSLGELREVARGIHPAVVSGHGLAVALEQLTARAPVPVRLKVEVDERLPEPIEVAAYYLVSESLANVAKHASASSATIEVSRTDGEVVVEIVDDGIGGADSERGSGLRGLADRVEVLGGRLRVWSPHDGGTRVRAEIPCAS
jgi:signal transduction histidine kinase